jgi:hypothetical protein
MSRTKAALSWLVLSYSDSSPILARVPKPTDGLVHDSLENKLLAKLRVVAPLPLRGLHEKLVQLRCVDQARHDPVRCDASSSQLLGQTEGHVVERGRRDARRQQRRSLFKSSEVPNVIRDKVPARSFFDFALRAE